MKYLTLLFFVCEALATPIEDRALEEFVIGNHKFSAAIYKELLNTETGNFIASPLSAETVLALTNEGAKGDTTAELVKGLFLPKTKENTQKAFKTFLPNLKRFEENLKLLSANKIYIEKGLKLEDEFKSIASNIYNSGVENIEFERSTEAAGTINHWVEENTNNRIKNLIKPSDITEATRMILVNALYFSGQWEYPFESYATVKKQFYKNKDNFVEVDTMQQVDTFNYYANPTLKSKFLELPYRGANISMVIALPNEIGGLSSLEPNIEQLFAPQPFSKERVKVELPTFTIETEIKFIPILQNLGIRKLFSQEADLSGLSSTDKALYVSDVLQKAFINVTESGTEAAAATSVGVALLSAPIAARPAIIFRADHPFTYYIKENQSGVILFFGRYKP